MEMDNKKKGILMLVIAGVVLLALLGVWFVMSGKKPVQEPRKANVEASMPEADVTELPKSKTEAYMRRDKTAIEDYMDYLDDPDGSDPVAEMLGEKKEGGSKSKDEGAKIPSFEELFGSTESRNAAAAERERKAAEKDAERRKMLTDMQESQNQLLISLVESQKENQNGQNGKADGEGKADDGGGETLPVPEPAPERDRIDVERVKVVRSGGISSMDDDFASLSSGISSLDSEGVDLEVDDAYPFKCMFVRQEKLKNGQRVSVRLLEDIVVEGQLVKKNTHLNAVCNIGDRIDIKVSNIELGGRIVTLDFDAYDTDGVKGIYAPDLAKDDQLEYALKQAGLSTVRRRMSTQVGQTIQDLVSAGSMVITGTGNDRSVTVPSGYQFYLVKSRKIR